MSGAHTGRRCPRCDCADGHTQCEHCKVCQHAAPLSVACYPHVGEQPQASSALDQVRRDRDELRALLYEVLGHFVHKGHPGEPCLSSGWISVRTVDRWRNTLNEAVAAASKENKA
ncbi:hypothetical protein [Streptomyces sp. NPDC060027]|uniref:hypothetical protein n=1 Tax=Streptomyces sp. NPDC060027 TaxID=3347040 RepID=UPI003677C155